MNNNYQKPMFSNNQIPQGNFYGGFPPGINWQQEMMNRLGNLQNQIQNSFTNQQQQQIQQNYLKGRIAGSKEEVLSAQVDFNEAQYFPVGNDAIFVKKLGLDGRSQVLEYRLITNNENEIQQENKANEDIVNEDYNILKSNYEDLLNKYNFINNELNNLKTEINNIHNNNRNIRNNKKGDNSNE